MVCTPAHVCDARSARWRNRQGGVSENLIKNAALAAGALLRTDTRELHRGPGRLQPHTEAEYICADGHLVALITLVRRGLTIHFFRMSRSICNRFTSRRSRASSSRSSVVRTPAPPPP